MTTRYLVIDANNMLYRAYHGAMDEDVDTTISRCHHSALLTMNTIFKKYKADDIVLAFDHSSWRKIYTSDKNPDRVTHEKYKGGRRKNKTESELARLKVFDQHVTEFYEMMKEHTSMIVLRKKHLEADDLIACFVQGHPDDKHIVLSADKDFLQLLRQPNVFLIDPKTEKERTLADWDFDADFFMVEKCIRGEGKQGDNVMSSYPRLRKNKIRDAMKDEYAMTQIMQHTFEVEYIDEKTNEFIRREYKTEDVFKENQILMDLTMQPEYIRELADKEIANSKANRGRYHRFNFLKYCRRYGLDEIQHNIDYFTPMLNTKRKLADA